MNTLKSTEGFHPDAVMLDALNYEDVVKIILEDQRRAFEAVGACPFISLVAMYVARHIDNGGRLIYVGAGTSGRVAISDAAECVPTFGIDKGIVTAIMAGGPHAFIQAVEGAEDNEHEARRQMEFLNLTYDDVVCGITASGSTPFVLAALTYAREKQSRTLLIRNTVPDGVNATQDFIVDGHMTLYFDTGPEVISGSTRMKAGTAQTIFLKTLTTTIFTLLGKTYGGLMIDVKVTNEKLRTRAKHIVRLLTCLPKKEAGELLDASSNSAKTAIVMHHRKVNRTEAEMLLEKYHGRLRNIIGNINYTKVKL
jgi:N-acetylmuramic acid 6-phosphate etherase